MSKPVLRIVKPGCQRFVLADAGHTGGHRRVREYRCSGDGIADAGHSGRVHGKPDECALDGDGQTGEHVEQRDHGSGIGGRTAKRSDGALQTQSNLADLTQTNLTQVTSKYTMTQFSLQAAQQGFSMIQKTSLSNYIGN
ncbi:hypothetical protein [Paraburkholderia sartisoli]|uniref:hypothetical protein n=1 Tax=Paraburkholderia sartisoli TaxID=83784 RepID=UPI00159FDDE9|nr:hypothetical protein [Paraburkholderia sartisoli]